VFFLRFPHGSGLGSDLRFSVSLNDSGEWELSFFPKVFLMSKTEESLIAECQNCEAKVEAKILYLHAYPESISEDPYRIALVVCRACESPFLVGQCYEVYGEEESDQFWETALRLWPQSDMVIDTDFPELVGRSLHEAKACFKASAFDACAVMCGRVLEAICKEYKTNGKRLVSRLKELLEREIIDKKMFRWGDALRKNRNIGAHASDEKIKREDAKDLLEFAIAICEYVFVLNKKYEEFQVRERKREKKRNDGTLLSPPHDNI
jgi:hypothetical protein